MELWTLWTGALAESMQYLSGHFGLSEAAAIVVLTLAARIAMAPLSLAAGYQAHRNRLAMERIKPAIERLRERFKDNPQKLAARTLALYRENGIRFFGRLHSAISPRRAHSVSACTKPCADSPCIRISSGSPISPSRTSCWRYSPALSCAQACWLCPAPKTRHRRP